MKLLDQPDDSPTGPTIKRHKSKQDYCTPREFIDACEDRFGPLDFDLAATSENSKAALFFSPEDDALVKPWDMGGLAWLNPPFANIAPWAKKCAEAGAAGQRILFLTPASVGSNWFAEHVHCKALVLGLSPRMKFEGAKDPYPKDLILSVYGVCCRGFDVWRWKR